MVDIRVATMNVPESRSSTSTLRPNMIGFNEIYQAVIYLKLISLYKPTRNLPIYTHLESSTLNIPLFLLITLPCFLHHHRDIHLTRPNW